MVKIFKIVLRALQNGIRLNEIFTLVKKFKKKKPSKPVILWVITK